MTTDLLFAYVRGHLDQPARARVEAQLGRDAGVRRQLELLRQALAPLGADRLNPYPPEGLVMQTIARVAEHLCQELPRAPEPVMLPLASARSWWGRADVLLAACLLLAVLGLGVVGVYRLRSPESAVAIVECKNNMRQFFSALKDYHAKHGKLPNVAAEPAPRNVAGLVVPILADAGVLPENASLHCPGSGAHALCNLTLRQLRQLSPDEFVRHAADLVPCYAFSLGFRGPDNRYQPAALVAGSNQFPLLADNPPPNPFIGNSANHAGAGQNVLFADGSVRFIKDRMLGGDDIFLNRHRDIAAGVDATDFCLGSSAATP